jgi:hypothetical protein
MKKSNLAILTLTILVFFATFTYQGILFSKLRFYLETVERFRSKEVCSCHLSLGRDLALCQKDWQVIKWYPYFAKVDAQKKSVTVGLFRKTSVFVSQIDGCRLLN